METWKKIPGHENYELSTLGKVKNIKTGNQLNPFMNGQYLGVRLTNGKYFGLHQLIAMTYLNHVPNGMGIVPRHKNGIKTDNRLENIELGTQRDNSHDYRKQTDKDLPIGVTKRERTSRYKAQIKVKNRNIHLGYYDTPEEASQAYQKAIEKYDRRD